MSEMTRLVAIDRVGTAGLDVDVQAGADELPAIAARLRLPAIASLGCRFHLRRLDGSIIAASGALSAMVTQACVVSLDEFGQSVGERFEVRFVPAGTEADDQDPDAPDEIPYPAGVVDLGEAAIEQLALALDPYPRKPGLDPAADDEPAAPAPFAALAALRRPQ